MQGSPPALPFHHIMLLVPWKDHFQQGEESVGATKLNVRSPRRAYLPSPLFDLCGSVKEENDEWCISLFMRPLPPLYLVKDLGRGRGSGGRGGRDGGIISAELILSIHTEWLCPQRRLEGPSRLDFSPPKWKLVFWESYYWNMMFK